MLLAAVTLGAFALRLWGIGSLGDLDFDEQASFFIGSMPPREMLAYLLAAPFEHPPLFYLLFHAWLAAVGGSEAAMRVFAVFPGALAVPLIGRAVGRVAGPRGGLVAALLLALAPLHVYYSRDARMYSLLALWMALAVYALSLESPPTPPLPREGGGGSHPQAQGRPLRRQGGGRATGKRWAGVLLVAAGVAALATHYYAAVAVLAAGIAFGAARWDRAHQSGWAVALAGAGVAGAVAWFASASGFRTSLTAVYPRPVDPARVLEAFVQAVGAPFSGPLSTPEGALAGALLAIGPIAWLGLRGFGAGPFRPGGPVEPRQSPSTRSGRAGIVYRVSLWGFAATALGVPLLLLVGRAFAPRFGVLAVPFLAVLVGLAATRAPRGALALAGGIYGMAALVAMVPFYGDYTRADYGLAMEALRARVRPDDAIVLNGPWQDLLYRRYGWGLPDRYIIASSVPLEPEEAVQWLQRLSTTHRRLWIVDSATDAADPTGVVVGWLDAHAYPGPVIEFRKALLRPYLTDRGRPELQVRALPPEAQDLGLASVSMDRWTLVAGDEARLRIELARGSESSGADPPPQPSPARREGTMTERRVSVQLVGQEGGAGWHWDGLVLPAGGREEYRAALVVPADAQPGDYSLRAMVYERDAASRRTVWASERVDIGRVRVKG